MEFLDLPASFVLEHAKALKLNAIVQKVNIRRVDRVMVYWLIKMLINL